MSSSARYVSAVLLVILGLTVTVCAQSTTKQTTKTPKGSVSGRVTIKDKGAPGVALGLRKSDAFGPFESSLRTTTDHDGFYRITNVPAGSYHVLPAAPAFVVSGINDGRGKSVVVGEDENVDEINFSLVRGGVITGKVTDAEGRPAIQQQVSIYQADAFNQQQQQQQQGPQRPIYSVGGAQTDDRGIYRMYGLSAGRYKVASGRGDDSFSGTFMATRVNYKQVFHPDVTEHSKAIVIEVSEGSEANNVDIKLGPAMQTFSVSGRVIDGEKGLPMPNIRFGLQRLGGQRAEFVNIPMMSNAAGDFFAEGLVPGEYSIYLFQNISTEMRADSFSFNVVDQDVSDVVIKLTKGATLSGVVVLESEDKALFQKVLEMQLRAYVMPPRGISSGFGQSSSSPIAADGSFRLPGLPAGTANISIGTSFGPPPKGFVISRIERDGMVNPRGVEIKEGEQVTGLRVVVAFGNATIRGVVKLENGSLPQGMALYVRLTKPGETAQRLPPVQVDARGHFLMEGVPPGQYELSIMVPSLSGGRPRTVKQDVSVQNGVVTDVVFTVDLSSPPTP